MKMRLVVMIAIINALVFLQWNFSRGPFSESQFMIDNFLISWTALTEGRVWTLLTSAFSHNAFFHLFFNMYVLLTFGAVVEMTLGRSRFLKLYLAAAVISSFCHAAVSNWIMGDPSIPALGASGAISAIVIIFALKFPKERILLFGLLPIPAFWGAVLFVGLDIWGVIAQAGGGGLPIGHGAHLGGALTGLLYYFLIDKNSSRAFGR